jgi:NAD(P)-dependent dehydrogenase (short-subunit alcohol dehydrogenase family)
MNNEKIVIVTGTSRGIGKAIAHYLCKNNYNVIGIDKAESLQDFTQINCDLKNWEETSFELNKILIMQLFKLKKGF